jgi:hypothetical protein
MSKLSTLFLTFLLSVSAYAESSQKLNFSWGAGGTTVSVRGQLITYSELFYSALRLGIYTNGGINRTIGQTDLGTVAANGLIAPRSFQDTYKIVVGTEQVALPSEYTSPIANFMTRLSGYYRNSGHDLRLYSVTHLSCTTSGNCEIEFTHK